MKCIVFLEGTNFQDENLRINLEELGFTFNICNDIYSLDENYHNQLVEIKSIDDLSNMISKFKEVSFYDSGLFEEIMIKIKVV